MNGQEERHEKADAPQHLHGTLHPDDAADVVGVLLTEVVQHVLPHAVHLAAELLEVLAGHVLEADVRLAAGIVGRERLRRLVVVDGAVRLDRSVGALA